jgi:hypothetical protein
MAKLNPLFILVGVLALAFVGLLVSSSSDYLPYDNKASKYANYEPLSPMNADDEDEEPTASQSTASSNSLPNANENFGAKLTSDSEGFEPMLEVPTTVKYGPLRDSEIIDKFSQVTLNGMDGVNGCVSSGLSNAGGQICLTPELIDLLKTRGGNASGK